MAYGLSFSEEFFTGDGEVDVYDIEPSDKPTSVLQAIISMDANDKLAMTRELFEMDEDAAKLYIDSESWGFDVLDKVRETDTCGDLSTPVDVWIDDNGRWVLDVYDSSDE